VFTHAELLDATVSRHGLAIPQNVSRLAKIGPKRVGPRMGGTTVSLTVVFSDFQKPYELVTRSAE
jgi:hypothetical protein